MAMHAPFLATIIADPDSDGPRLVYADWLEERGDPRGEFIRVQCRISDLNHELMSAEDCEHPSCPGCVERRQLANRQEELLTRHAGTWMPNLGHVRIYFPNVYPAMTGVQFGDGSTTQFVWHRGFVEEITCDWSTWGGGECRHRHDAVTVGDQQGQILQSMFNPSLRTCPRCSGAGRVPGHAATLLSATSIRKVRLTTWPVLVHHSGDEVRNADEADVRQVLKKHWPGITFELPVEARVPEYPRVDFEQLFPSF